MKPHVQWFALIAFALALSPASAALWKYKAIYRLRDEQVGNWSDVISVAVGT